MNVIWRFYLDHNHRWKWQRMSADRTVIAESAAAYKEYEGCLADAGNNGHVFQPSQPKLVHGRSC
jgi:hypothetical protein